MKLQNLRETLAAKIGEAKRLNDVVKNDHKGEWPQELRETFDGIKGDVGRLKTEIESAEREEQVSSWESEASRPALSNLAPAGTTALMGQLSDREVRETVNDWCAGRATRSSSLNTAAALGFDFHNDTLPIGEFRNISPLNVGFATSANNLTPVDYSSILVKKLIDWFPAYQVCGVVPTSGRDYEFFTSDDSSNIGRKLAFDAGTAQANEVKPTPGKRTLNLFEYTADVTPISRRLLLAGAVDVLQSVLEDQGIRLGRIFNSEFTNGTGNGQTGIEGFTTSADIGKTVTHASTLAWDNIEDLMGSVQPAYRYTPTTALMMHSDTYTKFRKFKDQNNVPLIQLFSPGSLSGNNGPQDYRGVPVVLNNDMLSVDDVTNAGGAIVAFGDWSQYKWLTNPGYRTLHRYDDSAYGRFGAIAVQLDDMAGGALLRTEAVKLLVVDNT